jgi:DNA/RNA-binding domain of Phe-tRNA-synthetase-like protein
VESLLPISLIDLDRAEADHFLCRRGREEESYVFNPSGQVLDLRDLLLLARPPSDAPCATPVKDSQATKTHQDTTRVLGVIYAPEALSSEAGAAAERMAELLARFGQARATAALLRSGGGR